MCGLVGIASQTPVENHDLLSVMRDTMQHRGPDDAGLWWSADRLMGLGHRRLAIIDLSPGGHQPMADHTGRLQIAFNGEIYNYRELKQELSSGGHRFQTASDTEVILEAYRAWGVDCLKRLNGMFTFALYDSSERQLLLARDRAGEKPLFYRHTSGHLVFASELKALMADPQFPRRINMRALEFYLAYGYVPGEMCILDGVHKLGQGQALIYRLESGHMQRWPYWQLPAALPQRDACIEDLAEELDHLLEDAVRRQMVADVPVGILLSGGIDSSLVTAMAARVSSQPVKTFTISFPGYGTYDEGPYARLVAQHFGTEHTELAAESSTVALLPKLARQFDEPMADSSMIPTYIVSRLIREHATVAVGGDGGDELFGGYWHYSWLQQQDRVRRIIPGPIRRGIGAASRSLPVGLSGRNYLLSLTADLPLGIASFNMYFDKMTRRRLLAGGTGAQALNGQSPEAYKVSLCARRDSPLQKATAMDFGSFLVDDILVKVDRASMLASLEVRAPWLDYRLVEFAFRRVPDKWRATIRERKILPRYLARRLLPDSLDLNRKQGFSLPLQAWFKGEWGAYVESVLCEAEPALFNQDVIQQLIAGQRRGYSNTQRLYALAIFELWRREYKVAIG